MSTTEKKSTTEMPAVTDRVLLEELTRSVKTGFQATNANIDSLHNEVGQVKQRIGSLETWRADQESRITRHSTRARDLSDHDMSQDAAIAEVLVRDERVEAACAETTALVKTNNAQTERILSAVGGLMQNPRVKALAWAISTALLAWLASKGYHQ